MVRSTPPLVLPLPKGWPKHVRSAVIHTISMAQVALTATRSWAANNWNARIRLKAENDRLRQEISLLEEEMRIKDDRMRRIPAHRRPHYAPVERMAILELRAARGWSLAQTARRLLVSTATVASWMRRLDEEGPEALVQLREPVNKYPLYIRYAVKRLKVLCPLLGKAKLAQFVARSGLHVAVSSIGRFIKEELPDRPPEPLVESVLRGTESRGRNHIWLTDLTTVPISFGFWLSWLPFSLPQHWPYCWWVAIVIDHYSRKLMGFAVFTQQPTSLAVRTFLGRLMQQVGAKPRYLITDQGEQFTAPAFKAWARHRHGIRQRFGAIGKHGSIAVIERLMRTIKQECTRRLLVPYSKQEFSTELTHFTKWYNGFRPHDYLQAATPDEVYRGVTPAGLQPRFEPRARWPRDSPCAGPREIRGRPGDRIEFNVRYLAGRKHLPIVSLKRVA